MNVGLKDRIKYLLREKDCTILELGGSENQRCKLSRQLNNSSAEVTTPTIMLILERFPDVSAEWLLRGEGTMDKSGHFAPSIHAGTGSIVQSGHNSGDASIYTPSQFELYGKDAIIAAKDDQIALLMQQLTQQRKDIDILHGIVNALTPNCRK